MQRTILVVDDADVNRKVLSRILQDDYSILDAADGREALAILHQKKESISAILLDLVMPVMDGYALLAIIRADKVLSQIPVIVTTSSGDVDTEVRVLSLGANDFIAKPYNPAVIRHRLRNTINLRETSAYINALRRDKLTGLYSREAFFQKAAEMIAAHEPGHYIMACFDIDNFKVINDQYGNVKGDHVLQMLADIFRSGFEPAGGICCRVTADNFAMLYPRSFINAPALADIRRRAAALDGSIRPISFSTGRYVVNDLSLSASAMYDRASMALNSVKARFDVRIAQYDESMREDILREQELLNEMNAALAQGQFAIWLQPQYNHSSGALIGAEALVRWQHPKKGMIPPGVFIPVFERNGFIYEMDKSVWEQACALIRKWLDQGCSSLPLSVNVSRYDVFREDFFAVITGLVEKYRVPLDMLRLEITESAFAKSMTQIIGVVKRLVAYGFTVEIDDFGSGYSSLNTLKDVPAQVLKLDMRFLESTGNSSRGGNILQSIVRMAKWLGMSVIAEGVETREQADYLKSIGCFYVQGYLYARPMPSSEYEALAARCGKEREMMALETVESLDNDAFWDPQSMETLIFNSYVGGACIFEYGDGGLELLRVNEKYARELGGENMSVEDALGIELVHYMDARDRAVMLENIENAIRTDAESSCEIRLSGLPGNNGQDIYLRAAVRVIARAGDRMLLYCSIINTTAQRQAEQKERMISERLRTIMENVNGGVSAVTIDESGLVHFAFANDRYYSILGYSREQFAAEVANAFDVVHPGDRPRIEASVADVLKSGGSSAFEYRCFRRDGSLIHLRCTASVTGIRGVGERVLLSVTTDITEIVAANEKIVETDEQLRFLNDTARDLLAQPDPKAGIECVLRKILLYFDADRAYVIEMDAKKMVSNNTYEVCAPGIHSEMANLQEIPYEASAFWWSAFEGDSYIHIGDVSTLDSARNEERKILEAQGIASLIAVPLRRDGNLIGFIGVDDPRRPQAHVDHLRAIGDYMAVILTRRDLTARIENDNQTLRSLTNSIPGGLAMYEVTPGGVKLLYCSDGFYALTGYGRDAYLDMAKRDPLCLIFSEDRPHVCEQIEAILRGASFFECTYRARGAEGGYRWLLLRGSVLEKNGDTVLVNVLKFDITKRMRAEEALRIREKEYLLAIDHGGKLIYRYSHADNAIDMPQNTAQLFGLAPRISDMPQGVLAKGVIAPECVDTYIAFFAAMRRGDRTGGMTVRRKVSDGSYRHFSARFGTVFDDQDKPVSAIVVFEDVTEALRKDSESAAHRENEHVLRLVAQHSSRLIYRYDLATRTACADAAEAAMRGAFVTDTNLPESLIEKGAVLPESTEDFRRVFRQIHEGKQNGGAKVHVRDTRGRSRWFDLKYSLIPDGEQTPRSAVLSLLDITANHEKELAYHRYLQTISQGAAAEGILIYLEADVTSDVTEKQGGSMLPAQFPPVGASRTEMIEHIAARYIVNGERDKCRDFFSREHLITAFSDGKRSLSQEWSIVFPDGTPGYIRSEMQMVQDPYSGHIKVYTILRDITDEKRAALSVKKRAETDGMTGLYNKTTTEALIRRRLSQSDATPCALLLFDLDNLKAINDTRGHNRGDEAIRLMADGLRAQFRKTDIVGRIGGDEFAVFLDGLGNEARLRAIIMAFMREMASTRTGENETLILRGSIGIATGISGADTYEALFQKADKALYHVKRNGKDDFAFYTPDMEQISYRYEGSDRHHDSLDGDDLRKAVRAICPAAVCANLTQNSCRALWGGEHPGEGSPGIASFDQWVAQCAAGFHPQDRDSFLAAFQRQSLLAAYARAQTLVSHEGRRLEADGPCRHVRTDAILVPDGRERDILAVVLPRALCPANMVHETLQHEIPGAVRDS